MCVINDHMKIDKKCGDIYSLELEFEKENIKTSEAYFLDLSILIENKKNKAKLFDKRDAFPFYIV